MWHWRDNKAKLVAKEHTQSYRVNYQELTSPIAKMKTSCILSSLAANFGWSLQQLDVKNAFWHDDLEKCVMETPSNFIGNFKRNNVFKLRKALYSLKLSQVLNDQLF